MESDEDTHLCRFRPKNSVKRGPEIPSARWRNRYALLLTALVVLLTVGGFLLVGNTHTAMLLPQRAQWCQVTDPGEYTHIYDIAALSPTNAWLVGDTLQSSSSSFAHWDGHHWNTVASGGSASVSLYALQALNANDIWAVGARTVQQAGAAGASQVTRIEHWDGRTWEAVESPDPHGLSSAGWSALSGLSASAPNDVWAVGAFSTPASTPGSVSQRLSFLEHWDGHAWSLVPLPETVQQSAILSIAALAHTDLWILAQKVQRASGSSRTTLAHWDGRHWLLSDLSSVGPGIALAALKGPGTGDLWGAGSISDTSHNVALPLMLHWDGVRWTRISVPSPENDSWLDALQVVSTTDIWAAGATGTNGIFLEHWDGKTWQMVSLPASKAAHAVDVNTFGATRGNVWVVEQSFVNEQSSDPHIETSCP